MNESIPSTLRQLIALLRQDITANRRNPKGQLVMTTLRMAQYATASKAWPNSIAKFIEFGHRLYTEFILGIELRPKTVVGAGLTIHHGVGLTVNDHTKIGSMVKLRNGVTIGNRLSQFDCPVIEDGVDVGANAVIIGSITIGENSRIGAGAVVLRSCPANSVLVGNPARIVPKASIQ